PLELVEREVEVELPAGEILFARGSLLDDQDLLLRGNAEPFGIEHLFQLADVEDLEHSLFPGEVLGGLDLDVLKVLFPEKGAEGVFIAIARPARLAEAAEERHQLVHGEAGEE